MANTKSVVKRTLKDYPQIDEDGKLTHCIERLDGCIKSVYITDDYDGILGTEGNGAKAYFDVFDSLILHQKDDFYFAMRIDLSHFKINLVHSYHFKARQAFSIIL